MESLKVINKLDAVCRKHFLEYTIDGGSKHPDVVIHIWSTYDTNFHVYTHGASFEIALRAALKQLSYCYIEL